MYCTFCGKQIADDAAFCGHCGKPAPRDDGLAELVAAARMGDQDAVSALYEKTYSKVYYTVKSMIKDEDAVFDIIQDTYIKAFAHLDSFQGDTKFLPWVRQIAANASRDWLKKKRPMLFSELNSDNGQDTPVEELFPDERSENLPEQVIDRKETKRLLREIIEELPEDQRAAIGMFYYEELSVKEIAAAMDVSESAVKSRLMYGRNKIEKKVRELEKQGTKLYSLSPLAFLLLLFRSQNAYGAEAPNSQILHAILAAQHMGAGATAGAVPGASTTGSAAGAGAASSGAAGAAAGGEAT
ncbi:MAG: sigma-70 family RNA polymerase sigma factor, partial [Acetatifactor muris]|nr:sigma-70 family RNA polymerase sigma factor [Acetatifactor muris]